MIAIKRFDQNKKKGETVEVSPQKGLNASPGRNNALGN
jgi:hypothetical protein